MKQKKANYLAITVMAGFSWLGAKASFASTVFNGGKVISCKNASGATSLKLLDFDEAKRERGWEIDFGNDATTVEAKLQTAFRRVSMLDPERARYYQELYQDFLKSYIFVEDADLPVTEDVESPLVPQNCQLMQAAVQRTPASPLDKRYFINTHLFNALSVDDRSGLILHELIYRDAAERGHKTADAVRRLVSLIASNSIAALNHDEYFGFLLDQGFLEYQMTWTHNNTPTLVRFFDKIAPMNFANALTFCQKLSGRSDIVNSYLLEGYWDETPWRHDNAISRKIFGKDGRGSQKLWVFDGGTRPAVLEFNCGAVNDKASLEELHGVFCFSENYR